MNDCSKRKAYKYMSQIVKSPDYQTTIMDSILTLSFETELYPSTSMLAMLEHPQLQEQGRFLQKNIFLDLMYELGLVTSLCCLIFFCQ